MKFKIRLEDVLNDIGFKKVDDSWKYDFGEFEINAYKYFDPFEVFHFHGSYISERNCGEVDFKTPAELDDYNQGLALVSYYFRNINFKNKPEWLVQGLALQDELPWKKEWAIQAKKEVERKEFLVQLDYDLFKVVIKRLKAYSLKTEVDFVIYFSFDGELLRIEYEDHKEILSGTGKAWDTSAKILSVELDKLPKRLNRSTNEVILYQDAFYLCREKFKNIAFKENKSL